MAVEEREQAQKYKSEAKSQDRKSSSKFIQCQV